ncbi:8038_t:CDS:2 [Diversispora eburnea]|uniref:8038_t:CDS:1 n=1 Tax=Diversispora eburnea TaxID=1213867 RepID=A0A9N8VMN1_9GLOM|nr:8038_t:CDS:2 [Diversispora eburnea]
MDFYNLFSILFILLTNILNIIFASQSKPSVAGIYFDRIITIVLGNSKYDEAIKDPYLSFLASQGISLTEFHAVWHPSQPNYIAMICSSKSGVLTDFSQNINGPSLPILLEEKGISWKAYLENYPGKGFAGDYSDDRLYYRKHNPFISMNNIRNNKTLVSKIVNAEELTKDISEGNSLLIITFDESSSYFDLSNYNHIYTTLIGPNVLTSYKHQDNERYNHYDILPTIQINWNLSELGTNNDKQAKSLSSSLFLIN